ncbi:hypothetical protein I302_102739 [Kwoniella bestiolae CBS 10118]|uniref:Uncharacterized protein n=1 Tax=Kwoniella bestiolae CBS 10118 TaxID=1296100 RepID=A0A1B9GFW6_9TREE|nr:hypothetical protein I302_01432 [Kwoniella bestiolae CBS 10118]OCF29919.1 hypothetical protein I302_01432 [Kwoniella bestiolae CBS 10118]
MFVAQIENILAQVSPEHGKLEKSDILLIVGALRVRDFAIGVANCTANEPIDGVIHTGRAQSSATPNQKPKSSRGKVPESSNADPTATTTKSTGSQNIPGEVYEPKDMALEWLENVYRVGNPYCAVKVSHPDGPQLDVCLSVLRFAPGADEPTIYRD